MFLKKKIHVWAFFLPFCKVSFDDGAIWYYCTLCYCVEPSTKQKNMKGVIKYTKKTPPEYGTMPFMVMQKKITRCQSSLGLRKTSHPNNAY